MPRFLRTRTILAALIAVVALIAAACTSSGQDTPSTQDPSTTVSTSVEGATTTEAPLTSVPASAIPGTNSPTISNEVAAAMREDIGVLMLDAEESRGLPFLSVPTVTILDMDDFTARVNDELAEELSPEELASDEALLKLLGMLDDDVDLSSLLLDLYTEQVAGFYDPDAKELVVPVSVDGMTVLQKVTIVHELVHALTDQHFDFNDEYERLVEEGNGDDASGVLALVEGDATYQQFLYVETLSPFDAAQAAIEILSFDTTMIDSVPNWMRQDLGFPYEHGLTFVGQLVETGGLKALDEAYQDLPNTSEQILDPNKYLRKEQPDPLTPLTVTLDGWELADEATFGEWGIRLLLTDAVPPGAVTQAAAGWGNDSYRQFVRGDDTAMAWVYLGETEQDAKDLVDALIVHVRGGMGASGGQESGGGLLFDGGDPWVFVDRVDDMIYMVVSNDPVAGADLRTQLGL
ncbi:MAG: hypothetical protein M3094_00455 [Actinomycetia bacterium]|nr:hypothetical protein [Actinomycetes bacterium]